jgi:MFS family permease
LTRGAGSVGLASFFSDFGHEITTSILPSFVTVTLRSSAAALGVIEGVSDALTGLAKVFAGPLANDERRRLRMASGGYLVTAAATGAVGLAATVWQAGLLRATAWLARGVRSPARDAMLASLAPREAYGRAFGLERAGDNMGAVAGPLLAAGLVAWLGIRPALYLAAIPGVLAAAAITAAASEARKRHDPNQTALRAQDRGPPRRRNAATAATDRGI